MSVIGFGLCDDVCWIVGVSYCREGIEVCLCGGVVHHYLNLLWMFVVVGGLGRFSPS